MLFIFGSAAVCLLAMLGAPVVPLIVTEIALYIHHTKTAE